MCASIVLIKMPRQNKTPVSILQEMCAKCGITPKYDLLQVEGVVHEPTFVYRVTVDNVVCTGQGLSKKKAKHTAAKAVLDKLMDASELAAAALQNDDDRDGDDGNKLYRLLQNNSSSVDRVFDGDDADEAGSVGEIDGNPVGELQELCLSHRWPPPIYQVHEQHGLPHQPTFAISCTVGAKYTETGVGKSKRVAKKKASHQMLQRLRDTVIPGELVLLDEDEDEEMTETTALSSTLSKMRLSASLKNSSSSTRDNVQTAQFHQDLRKNPGEILSRFMQQMSKSNDSEVKINHIRVLKEVAAEKNYDITWVDIDEVSTVGRHQCVVQLSTTPVAVCFGDGCDVSMAREDAAKNMLMYLRVMATSTVSTNG